jgi:choline transporter-like protein 2/4/5
MVRQADIDEANKPENKITKKGIEWDRSCTDMLCCLIFVAFIASMFFITGYAVSEGDPVRIITPFDSVGNRCGAENQGIDYDPANTTDFTEFKYKHFTSLVDAAVESNPLKIYEAICVKECPLQD